MSQIPVSNQTKDHTWKIIRNWLVYAAVFLTVIVMVPYSWIVRFLSVGEADGTFDSLSQAEHTILITILAVGAALLFICACFITIQKERMTPLFDKIAAKIKSISLRKDVRELWTEIKGSRTDRWLWIFVAIVTSIGVFIRLIYITQPVAYDEAYTFLYFAIRPIRFILTDYSAPNNHILHTILVSLSYHLFGNHIWALRLPAFLAGVMTIPMLYLAGKAFNFRLGGAIAALAAAFVPMFVDFSVNGRGYSLTVLLAVTALWFTGLLVQKSKALYWVLLSFTCIAGFYTIPIFLYPFGCIYLFLFINWIYLRRSGEPGNDFLTGWLLSGLFTGIATFFLYLPVILLGTGWSSIVGNEFVKSAGWNVFLLDFIARSRRIWSEWTSRIPQGFIITGILGLGLAFIRDLAAIKRKFPFWLAAIVWVLLAVFIQRVTPWPRVWLFLLAWVLLWSASGFEGVYQAFKLDPSKRLILDRFGIAIIVVTTLVMTGFHYAKSFPQIEISHEQQAAEYIVGILKPEDTLVAVSPVPIQVGYYLSGLGIPYQRFYNRDRPHEIERAIMIVVDRSKFPTIESVVAWQHLDDKIDIQAAELLYSHKRVNIYAIPGK